MLTREKVIPYYVAIGLVSMATLLLETSMMRVFSVLFANHFAFMIISTAILGFAAAGAVLPLLKRLDSFRFETVLAWTALLYAGAICVALLLVILVPLKLLLIYDNPGQLAYLLIYYVFLSLPFFFGGLTVAYLISKRIERVNTLYFSDLVGAGIGCLLVIPLLPHIGASGSIMFAAFLASVAAVVFSAGSGRITRGLAVTAVLFTGALLPMGTGKLEVPIKEEKRRFAHDDSLGRIEYTKWSPISRIDVAPRWPAGKTIWIDAGSNESVMVPFDGDYKSLPPDTTYRGLPYKMRPGAEALIIGPSGGREVLAALSHGVRFIDAVELDPVICHIVTHEYKEYIGDIFGDPRVNLVVDEGRSYLRRSGREYDVIQQINNFTPVALASGSMNLSETYLTTVEAFLDYLDHLKPDGLLAIYRWGELRLASVALAALERAGIEAPWRHLAFIDGGGWAERQFLMRKTPFPQSEIDSLAAFAARNGFDVLYLPDGRGQDDLLRSFIHSEDRTYFYENAGFNLFPSTDNRPFFDHFEKFGRFSSQASMLPDDFKPLLTYYNIADLTLLGLLLEAALLSFLFILFPNWLLHREGLSVAGKWTYTLYFSCLGLGFIMLEIAAMQRFTLFIGSPLYAVTTVLFSLLVSAGVGSFLARRRKERPLKTLLFLLPIVVAFIVVLAALAGPSFRLFLGASLPVRAAISFCMIAPLGLVMGAPFPLGLRATSKAGEPLVPWMWAVNGYATVIGSVLAVIVALNVGFTMVFGISAFLYCVAFFAAYRLERLSA